MREFFTDKPPEEMSDDELARNIRRIRCTAVIFSDGQVQCATWSPLGVIRDAGIPLHRKFGKYDSVARKNISRAAAVLRLQGYEVTIEEG